MLKMAPFLTHIFMESWPCFFEIRVPTNGNICQSHFSNVNEMDGAAIHSGQKHFICKNKMYSKNILSPKTGQANVLLEHHLLNGKLLFVSRSAFNEI